MTMRILADENVDRPIARWLREQGHDVVEASVSASEATDAELIAMSRREARILITFDRDIGRHICSDSARTQALSTSACGERGQDSGKRSSEHGR